VTSSLRDYILKIERAFVFNLEGEESERYIGE
ncbi:uncharacterized protein METZ01_LOCUS309712, partial [marine metagenome]